MNEIGWRGLQAGALTMVLGTMLSGLAAAQVGDGPQGKATETKAAKYPLRLHILAVDETHKTVRMQPNWCGGSVPDMGGGAVGGGGGGADGGPCGGDSSTSFGGDDDFSGAGRGDLVIPPAGTPAGTQAVSFTYEGCSRVRVPSGFQALPARWKKAGSKLEVLIPTDDLTGPDRPMPVQKCTLKVTLHEFVYLRMRTGKMVQVSEEVYWKKPSLRTFLSGGNQKLASRQPPVVSVKELVGAKP